MEAFKKNINGTEFEIQGVMEGPNEICMVWVENYQFKMSVNDEGYWVIGQQVPKWIKELEPVLGEAIEEEYE